MKKIIRTTVMLIAVIFQGSAAQVPEENASLTPKNSFESRADSELQQVQEQKIVEDRLKGLGYFQ